MTLSNRDLDAYFSRIGFAGATAPTLDLLRRLQLLHTATFPFENLEAVLGRPVPLDIPSLIAKLIGNRRGGYCSSRTDCLPAC